LIHGQIAEHLSDATLRRYFSYNTEHPVLMKTLFRALALGSSTPVKLWLALRLRRPRATARRRGRSRA